MIRQKNGWAHGHPAHPAPTPLQCEKKRKEGEKIWGDIIYGWPLLPIFADVVLYKESKGAQHKILRSLFLVHVTYLKSSLFRRVANFLKWFFDNLFCSHGNRNFELHMLNEVIHHIPQNSLKRLENYVTLIFLCYETNFVIRANCVKL